MAKRCFIQFLACATLALLASGQLSPLQAATEKFSEREALNRSQAVLGNTLDSFTFRNIKGDPVTLSDYAGKPLMISLIYTSCFYTCPLIIQSLDKAADTATETFGEDAFNIVTIGFDTRSDTPDRMRGFASGQGIDYDNWHFLSGDAMTVDRLVEQLGFIFFPSAKGFDHLAQTTVIDSKGTIYRQIYGDDFDPPAVMEPLKDLIYGRRSSLTDMDGLINRIRLFCTIYDPAAEKYRFDYSIFISGAVGLTTILGLAILLLRILYRDWRTRRNA